MGVLFLILKIIGIILLVLLGIVALLLVTPIGIRLKSDKENGFRAFLRISFLQLDFLKIGETVDKIKGFFPQKKKNEEASEEPEKNGDAPEKKKLPKKKKPKKEKDEDDIPDIPDIPEIKEIKDSGLLLILDIVKDALTGTFRHLGIKINKLILRVAGKDAAETAVLYGAVYSAMAGFFGFLSDYKKVKVGKEGIRVEACFLGEKTEIEADVTIRLFIWQIAHVGLGAVFAYLSNAAPKHRESEKIKK